MIASMKIDDVTYKFHWDKTERRNVILETILVVIMLMIYLACIVLSVICVLKNMGLVVLLPVSLFLLFVAVPICWFYYSRNSHAISYMQIFDDQIVIKRWIGPKLVIEKRDIMYMKPVDAQELCEHTRPLGISNYRQPAFSSKQLPCNLILLGAPRLESRIYGKMTRYCNNVDELCLVALRDGQKLLINYPQELLKQS